MRIDAALRAASARLERSSSTTPRLDAEVMLAHLLRTTREHLAAYPELRLAAGPRARFRRQVAQRAAGVPVAYLTGGKEFYGLPFAVNRRVLIPRPESEALVDAVRSRLASDTPAVIADIGTGCGNLAVALARCLPQATVWAVDQSPAALAVARRNASRLGVRVRFRRGDLLKPLTTVRLDVVVANLPYLAGKPARRTATAKNAALTYEPAQALYSGCDGLALYRRLLAQLAQRAQRPQLVACEMEVRQWPEFTALAAQSIRHRAWVEHINGVSIAMLSLAA